MNVSSTKLSEVLMITPEVFRDPRGFFVESYHLQSFADAGITAGFVQDNHSRSGKGVLRGLHYQIDRPQGKLVGVINGNIFDVAADIRVWPIRDPLVSEKDLLYPVLASRPKDLPVQEGAR